MVTVLLPSPRAMAALGVLLALAISLIFNTALEFNGLAVIRISLTS